MEQNYLTLINKFWNYSTERAFNPSDSTLYFYLLNTCNVLSWKQPFGQSDRHLSMMLGVSVPTIRAAKKRLKVRELIDYKSPVKASRTIEGQTKYWFPISAATEQIPHIEDAPQAKPIGKKTKPQKLTSVVLPFASAAFKKAWRKLRETPKWKKKSASAIRLSLDKLKEFDEEFAIQLIEQAIIGNWQGLVFTETRQKYELWKQQKANATTYRTNNTNSPMHRKAEIVRRATLAADECSQPDP